jgi:TP901 family phage tail tape measure protein
VPLGARDILLVIRAQDQASGVILGVGKAFGTVTSSAAASAKSMMASGAALLALGTGVSLLGIEGISTLKGWTDEAIKYRQASALTLTQVDQLGISLSDIEGIGLRVARSVPVAFEQIQPALYDLFSSMDLNAAQAETMLTAIGHAAVAGQTDIQTAARSTIAIMNAYKIPVSEVNDVLDFQFRLVQKGVGTYSEFASTIGRAIPSARRAGQTYTTLGGVLAFLTRNGLSTAMAASSAARAMDSFANPTVQKRLQEMGIAVYDNAGGFRQINEVAGDLGKKLAGLTDPQKAAVLQELFKGAGGTIQARRFWDLAIRNYDELNQRVDEMVDKKGSLEAAYKTMFEQPQSQMQLFNNQLQALKISFGQALIPAFQELIKWGQKVVDFFNNLDPSTKAAIARFLLIASIVAIVSGVLLGLVGVLLLVAGAIELIGGIGAAIAWLSGFGLLLAGIAAAGWLVYNNWDTIKGWAQEWWPKIKEWVLGAFESIKSWVETNWPAIREKILAVWNAIKSWVEENWPKVRDAVVNAWNDIKSAVETAIGWMRDNVPGIFASIAEIAVTLANALVTIWTVLQQGYNWFVATFGPGFMQVWNAISENVVPIIEGLGTILQRVVTVIAILVGAIVAFGQAAGIWQTMWNLMYLAVETMVNQVIIAWNLMTGVISGALATIRGIVDFWAGLITGDWGRVWDGIKSYFSGIWTAMTALATAAMASIQLAIHAGLTIIQNVWNVTWGAITAIVTTYWNGIRAVITTAMTGVQIAITAALNVIRSVWDATWSAIMSITAVAVSIIRTAAGVIKGAFDAIVSALRTLQSVWDAVWGGLRAGIGGIVGAITGALGGIISILQSIAGAAKTAADAIRSIQPPGLGSIPSLIGGLLPLAIGATNVPPGTTFIAGEGSGPEIVSLSSRGATVLTPNRTSMALQGSVSGGIHIENLTINGGNGSPEVLRAAVEQGLIDAMSATRARKPR